MKAIWQFRNSWSVCTQRISSRPVDWRVTSQLGQDCPKGEIAAHADDKRRLLGGKHSIRPIDKAGKRGQKVGLAAVFRRGRLLCAKWQGHAGEEASEQREAPRDRFGVTRCTPCWCEDAMGCARHSWTLKWRASARPLGSTN